MKKSTLFLILSFLLCVISEGVFAIARQIEPSPNYGTIDVWHENDANYATLDNHGTVQVNAPYEETEWILFIPYTYSVTPTLYNWAAFNNYGTLNNYSLLLNQQHPEAGTGTLNNFGTLKNLNYASLHNSGPAILNNSGTLDNAAFASVHNSGTLSNSGTLNNVAMGSLNNTGVLINTGTLNNELFSTLNNVGTMVNQGTLNNTFATLNNQTIATLTNTAGATLNNAGVLDNSGSLNNSGTVNNSHTVRNNPGATLTNNGTLNNASLVTNSGNISGTGRYVQTAGRTVNNGNLIQAEVIIQGGTLQGTGSITGPVTLGDAATLAPGNSPGTMTINGTLSSSGTLLFEIAGLDAGQYDVLDVNGDVLFAGGALQFDFIDAFEAGVGDSWDFLFADSVTGWDTLDFVFNGLGYGLGWMFEQVSDGMRLVIVEGPLPPEPIPEPGVAWLLALGLLSLRVFRTRARG